MKIFLSLLEYYDKISLKFIYNNDFFLVELRALNVESVFYFKLLY